MNTQLERDYQHHVITKLKTLYPDCMVLKNDPNYIQGIPDLLFLKDKSWVALEVKRSVKAPSRPNQEYYIAKMNKMSCAAKIYPENEDEVFRGIDKFLRKEK